MAENIVKEQVYTIPLRDVKNVPRWRRANKAMSVVRAYLTRHMKVNPDNIRIDKSINEKIWERGSEKPPSYIRIRAAKYSDDVVWAELVS